MDKIATTDELTFELKRLLGYAQSALPSRVRLAMELAGLARRVAKVSEVDKLHVEITTKLLNRPGAEKKTYALLEKAFEKGRITSKEMREMESDYEAHFEDEKSREGLER